MSNYPSDPQSGGQESVSMPPQTGAPLPGGSVPPPPAGALYYTQVDKDTSDLKVLSIFWYVLAGLQAFASCILILYFLVILVFTLLGGAAGASSNEPGSAVPIVGVGSMFLCVIMIPLTLVLTIAFLNYKVGRSLGARKNLTLCYVMAALACLGFPLGTALGVFTFILLNRPSIKASFT